MYIFVEMWQFNDSNQNLVKEGRSFLPFPYWHLSQFPNLIRIDERHSAHNRSDTHISNRILTKQSLAKAVDLSSGGPRSDQRPTPKRPLSHLTNLPDGHFTTSQDHVNNNQTHQSGDYGKSIFAITRHLKRDCMDTRSR
ncbi:hypothetical protein CEXT_396921 [Caerostris extrusa]|uniref:Uncharacterized protein n=1 Tax=Caerostris extrusa TaxID=172846 RepID=A0AAV4Q8V9_CAEEX|nr:hypothetical protein CEXT_396921 [Caerostris extrusa]